jgi:hypothetical protein
MRDRASARSRSRRASRERFDERAGLREGLARAHPRRVLATARRHRGRAEQAGERGGQVIGRARGRRERLRDTQALEPPSVIELIKSERRDELRDAGRERPRRCPDATVVNDGPGAREECGERCIRDMAHARRKMRRELLGVARVGESRDSSASRRRPHHW